MKLLILFFLSMFVVEAYAQNDTSTFKAYQNIFEISPVTHKNVKWLNTSYEVLLIVQDSVFNTMSNEQIENKIRRGGYNFDIINDPDSIQAILKSRIKSIMILKKQLPKK